MSAPLLPTAASGSEIAALEHAVSVHPGRLPDWLPRFVVMIEYAASQGWVDGHNRRVRAHRERAGRD
ncbi:hypothetical protein FK531_07680 [Rhodococcus spelaei]|uniref:Uncharacterized protein n=1 Tax=Rhodococcus spelaei TaxID=2546320 RepID=A0A541BM47_9NOCA|nr:hypothetical protein [Rhodococcus spelaei]TQF73380.1 hypothetical protein FK531_07680 [Rhodococcus spelaei]